MKITKEELANIIKEEVEKALGEQERPSDEKALDFIKTDSAKEVWNSLGEEEKAKINNISQDKFNKMYDYQPLGKPAPLWYLRSIMQDAFTYALEKSKGSVEQFAKSLIAHLRRDSHQRGNPLLKEQEGQPSKEDVAMAARGYLSDYYERKGQVDFNSMERYTKLQKELEEYGQSGSLSPSASKNAKSIIEAVLKLSKEAPDYFKRYVDIGKDVKIQSYGL